MRIEIAIASAAGGDPSRRETGGQPGDPGRSNEPCRLSDDAAAVEPLIRIPQQGHAWPPSRSTDEHADRARLCEAADPAPIASGALGRLQGRVRMDVDDATRHEMNVAQKPPLCRSARFGLRGKCRVAAGRCYIICPDSTGPSRPLAVKKRGGSQSANRCSRNAEGLSTHYNTGNRCER